MKLAGFVRDENGAIAIVAGAAIAALVGVAAFTVDLSNSYSVQGRLQNAADAAALAAAQKLSSSEEEARAVALDFAQRNVGPADGKVTSAADVLFGQYDPNTKSFKPDVRPFNAVKVAARRVAAAGNPVDTYFGGIFGVNAIDVEAQAIAILAQPAACVFALDRSASRALHASGGGKISVPDCGIQVNSSASDALVASGSSTVSAKSICVRGGYSGSNISATPDPKCKLQADPLASVPQPVAPNGCDYKDVSINMDHVFPAGSTYCGNIKISGKANITLESGIHYFKEDSELHVSQSASFEGEEVLLFFDEEASFFLTSSGVLRITAPKSGPYRGIAIFGARSGDTESSKITGNRKVFVGGTIYTPRINLEMAGDAGLYTEMEAGYVITNTFRFSGSAEAIFSMRGGFAPSALAGRTMLVH